MVIIEELTNPRIVDVGLQELSLGGSCELVNFKRANKEFLLVTWKS